MDKGNGARSAGTYKRNVIVEPEGPAYRAAAEQGDPDAAYNLAYMYEDGEGVSADPVQALFWMTLSAAACPAGADRDDALSQRNRIAAELTQAEYAEAERLINERLSLPN